MSSLPDGPKGKIDLIVSHSRVGQILKPVWRREVHEDELAQIRGDTPVTSGPSGIPKTIDFRNPLDFCGEDKEENLSYDRLPNFLFHTAQAHVELHKLLKSRTARQISGGASQTEGRTTERVSARSAKSIAENLGDRHQSWSDLSAKWHASRINAAVEGLNRDISELDYERLGKVLPATLLQIALRATVESSRRRAKWAITRTLGTVAVFKAMTSYYETFLPDHWTKGDLEERLKSQERYEKGQNDSYEEIVNRLDAVSAKYSNNVGGRGWSRSLDDSIKKETYADLQDRLHVVKTLRNVLESKTVLKSVRKLLRGGNQSSGGGEITEDEGLKRLYKFLDDHFAQELQDEVVRSELSSTAPLTHRTIGRLPKTPGDVTSVPKPNPIRQYYTFKSASALSREIISSQGCRDLQDTDAAFEFIKGK